MEETLKPCRRFQHPSQGAEQIFIDRDPDVFRKTLKVLRGYPCVEFLHDTDVLTELCWLGHRFRDVALPLWMRGTRSKDTNHSLDPEQTARFSETRVLVSSDTLARLEMLQLLDVGVATRYPKCKVVGVGDQWVKSQWVPNHEFELAKTKLQFLLYFASYQIGEDCVD